MTQPAPIPTEADTLSRDAEAARQRLREERDAAYRRRQEREAASLASILAGIAECRTEVDAFDARESARLAALMPADPFREEHLRKRRRVAEAARALFRAACNPDAQPGHLWELYDAVKVALLP